MAYIGNKPTSATFAVDTFSGNGSTDTFTLRYPPASESSILVFVNDVRQNTSSYSLSGSNITLSPPPASGTNNIEVVFLGIGSTPYAIGPNSVGTSELKSSSITGDKLQANIIRANNIVANTITSNEIADGQVKANNLAATTVTPGNYGSSSSIPVITVDSGGRLTYAANVVISLGTIASQDANNINISGGTISVSNVTASNITANTVNASSSLYIGTYNYKKVDLGSISTNQTLDLSQGNYFKCNVNTGSTITFTTNNVPSGVVTTGFILDIRGGGNGTVSLANIGSSRTFFQAGNHPNLSPHRDLYSCITSDNGVSFYVLAIFVNGQTTSGSSN